jgi:hypothetical protein
LFNLLYEYFGLEKLFSGESPNATSLEGIQICSTIGTVRKVIVEVDIMSGWV